jgi:Spy/CpxP family protein refolding chaperone
MKRPCWLILTLVGTAALALAEPPPPAAPGATPEIGKAGPAGNPEVMRERMRRLGGDEAEGMGLRMLAADPRTARELGLSEDQLKQIRESMSGSAQDMKDLTARMEKAAMSQAELMKADALDEAAVLKAVQETGDLRTQIARLRIKQMIAAHKVLTPEQRAKVREIMARRVQQARQRLQEGGRDPQWKGRAARGERQDHLQAPPPPPPATPSPVSAE